MGPFCEPDRKRSQPFCVLPNMLRMSRFSRHGRACPACGDEAALRGDEGPSMVESAAKVEQSGTCPHFFWYDSFVHECSSAREVKVWAWC